MFPKARETTVKINKMGLNEVKNLLHREKNYQQSKTGHLLKERKHLQTMSLRGWYPKYMKNSHNSTSKNILSDYKTGREHE